MLIPPEPKILFLLLLAFFLLLFIIALMLPYSKTSVTIISGRNKTSVVAEIADNPITQAKGLMFRENLDEGQGMIFIFSGDEKRSFWMKNTLIPLDLIFVASNFTIVDIKENFQPCQEFECPRYVSKPAAYVLEVNAGFAEKHGIAEGDRIRISFQKA